MSSQFSNEISFHFDDNHVKPAKLQDFSRFEYEHQDPFFTGSEMDDCSSFSPRNADTADSISYNNQNNYQPIPAPTFPQQNQFSSFQYNNFLPQGAYLPFNNNTFFQNTFNVRNQPVYQNMMYTQPLQNVNFKPVQQPVPTPTVLPQTSNITPKVQIQAPTPVIKTPPSPKIEGNPNEVLIKLAHDLRKDWKKIAKRYNKTFGTKESPTSLKGKYKELTDKDYVQRVKFSHKEDLMIVKYFELHGTHWEEMSCHFLRRDPVMLKNRYYAFIRKRGLYDDMLAEVRQLEADGQKIDEIQELNEKSGEQDSGNEEIEHDSEDTEEEKEETPEPESNNLNSLQAIEERAMKSQDPEKTFLVNRVKELELMLNSLQSQVVYMKTRVGSQ